eukprot:1189469-Prorocentrum_minimum.AAC.6
MADGDENSNDTCNHARPWNGVKGHANGAETAKGLSENVAVGERRKYGEDPGQTKGAGRVAEGRPWSGAVVVLSGLVNPERGRLRQMVRRIHRTKQQVE